MDSYHSCRNRFLVIKIIIRPQVYGWSWSLSWEHVLGIWSSVQLATNATCTIVLWALFCIDHLYMATTYVLTNVGLGYSRWSTRILNTLYCRNQMNLLVDVKHCNIMPRSHRTFHPVPAVKLLRILLRSRCWPTTFHTVAAKDADGWCHKWLVRLAPQSHIDSWWVSQD